MCAFLVRVVIFTLIAFTKQVISAPTPPSVICVLGPQAQGYGSRYYYNNSLNEWHDGIGDNRIVRAKASTWIIYDQDDYNSSDYVPTTSESWSRCTSINVDANYTPVFMNPGNPQDCDSWNRDIYVLSGLENCYFGSESTTNIPIANSSSNVNSSLYTSTSSSTITNTISTTVAHSSENNYHNHTTSTGDGSGNNNQDTEDDEDDDEEDSPFDTQLNALDWIFLGYAVIVIIILCVYMCPCCYKHSQCTPDYYPAVLQPTYDKILKLRGVFTIRR